MRQDKPIFTRTGRAMQEPSNGYSIRRSVPKLLIVAHSPVRLTILAVFQFLAKEANHCFIKGTMERCSIEARWIPACLGRCCCKCIAAGRKESKVVSARHQLILPMMRKLFADDSAVPLVGSLRVVPGAPELDWDGDLPQIACSKQKTGCWRRYDRSFDPWVTNPGWFCRHGGQLISMTLRDKGAFRSTRVHGTELCHSRQFRSAPNFNQTCEASQGEAEYPHASRVQTAVVTPGGKHPVKDDSHLSRSIDQIFTISNIALIGVVITGMR